MPPTPPVVSFSMAELVALAGIIATVVSALVTGMWKLHRFHCRLHEAADAKRSDDVKALHERVDGCVEKNDLQNQLRPVLDGFGRVESRIDDLYKHLIETKKGE